MSKCPKCGSHRIIGPSYFKNDYGQEYLKYTCVQCGYSSHTPTLDSKSGEAK